MIDILYIAGSGRSGSTLLERMLGQLEGCAAVGELRHLWRRDPLRELCGCGRLLAECDFWQGVMAAANERLEPAAFQTLLNLQQQVDRMRYVPRMLVKPWAGRQYADNHVHYAKTLRHLYQAIQEVSRCRIIVDSSKDISTLHLLIGMPDVRVRILHMVRDSRAVAFSWMREKVRPQTVDQISYMPRYSPQKSAFDWMYRNLLTESAADRGTSYFRLRYEDLVSDPRGVTNQVVNFMGLSPVNLDYIGQTEVQLTRDNHTVSGNPMRFQKGVIPLRIDNAWQHEIKGSHRRIVTALTWPLLRRYGYA